MTPSVKPEEKMSEVLDFQVKHGVNGFFILGTQGEGVKLRPETRMRVAESVVEYVGEKSLTIVHVGASDMDTVRSLAAHASRIGAHAVSAVGPFYYRYDPESLANFYDKIAASCDAPVLVYNNPARQGYPMSLETIATILSSVRGVKGIKDSSGEPDQLLGLVMRFNRTHFLAGGSDALVYYTFAIGMHAHVSALASVYPDLVTGIHRALHEKRTDEALAMQHELNEIRRAIKSVGPDTASQRYALKLRGIDIGEPLPPTRSLTQSEKDRLESLLLKSSAQRAKI